MLVSHDRHLTGLVCETFWRVADGKVEEFNGDLDEYAAWLRSRGSNGGGEAESKPAGGDKGAGGNKKADKNADKKPDKNADKKKVPDYTPKDKRTANSR